MCMDGDILDLKVWGNYKTNMFFIFFLCGFKIKANVMHEHVMNKQEHVSCDEQPRTCEEHMWTFKNIQTYSRNLNK